MYVPPGAYSTGTLHLRSFVRVYVEAGATIYSIKDKAAFDKDALFYGEDVEHIALEGRGIINGEAAYEWRLDDIEDDFIRPNEELMLALGKPILRAFPKPNQYGKLVLLIRCRDVRISGLSFLNSPSWTIHPYGCERLVIDGVYIRSSLKEGVWADGIDPDGCKDVRIANSTIETGDDAICFYSMNWYGPALPTEHVTVTNCRLSSASSAIKFSDGNMNAIRNVTISNSVIAGANPDSWLEDVTIDDLRLHLTADPKAPYDKAVHGLSFRRVTNLTLRNAAVVWGEPASRAWESALHLEDIKGLVLEGFSGRQADLGTNVPAVVMNRVQGGTIRGNRAAEGTGTFLLVTDPSSGGLVLSGNDFSRAKTPYAIGRGVAKDAIVGR